jgi:hypothetical protein
MHPFLTPELAGHRERDVRREVAAARGPRRARGAYRIARRYAVWGSRLPLSSSSTGSPT